MLGLFKKQPAENTDDHDAQELDEAFKSALRTVGQWRNARRLQGIKYSVLPKNSKLTILKGLPPLEIGIPIDTTEEQIEMYLHYVLTLTRVGFDKEDPATVHDEEAITVFGAADRQNFRRGSELPPELVRKIHGIMEQIKRAVEDAAKNLQTTRKST